MEVMCNPSFLMMDGEDPLNFTLDDVKTLDTMYSSANINSTQNPDDDSRTFHESAEEELEWILNKDLFPAVETGLDIFAPPDHNNKSPSSVLDNNINGSPTMSYNGALPVPIKFKFPLGLPPYPRKKRSDRKRKVSSKMLMMMQQMYWGEQVSVKNVKQESRKSFSAVKGGSGIGRKCQHCLAEKTPQWRAGPMGPKTLCNACGVRYKSGRLVPEYRPASSPTFSSELHSNSHRKIVEMRRRVHGGDVMVK